MTEMPGPHHDTKYARPKDAKKTFLRILRYLKNYKGRLVLVAVAMLLSTLSGVVGNYFMKPILNEYIVPFIGQEHVDFTGFARFILLLAGIYALGVVCTFLSNRLMVTISTGVLREVRVDMFTHMQNLPMQYYDTHSHGELMSRYSNDTDTLRQMVSQSLPQLFSSVISVVGVFVMMIVLSWQLTIVVLLMLAVMMLIVTKIAGGSAKYFVAQQKELGTVNGYIEELIEGQKVVKVFCHEPQTKEELRARADALRVAAKNANTYANILFPIMGNLSHVHYVLTAVVGAFLTIRGALDIGTIGSFLLYTRSFSQPITQISQQLNAVLTALAGAERIFELIDAEPETDEGDITLVNAALREDGSIAESKERTGHWAWKIPMNGEHTYIELRGDVRFERVTFGYEPEKTVLKDLNFYAKPGQKIALVGSTGAGKTTITTSSTGFYDVQGGRILYDMIPVNRIKKADLRRSLAMVLQDTHLFTESVRENIRYGKLDASDADVEAAAKLANADFFIRHLPQGYDTVLTADGANLSQGQRQLLAIARAAVADPPVLILDEATSSIDTRTEAHIEKGMDSLMQGRTVFVIAHRLSTVRNADLILVIERGEIIERGSHEELLAQKGRYYQLYTGAFELA